MQEGSAVQRKCTRALGKVSPKLLGHVLALVGGAGPWRGDISVNPSQTGGLIAGAFLILIGLALVRFVRRPDPASA